MRCERGMAWWWATVLFLACTAGCLLAGCAFPGSVPTTVKVGLSAPFEGGYRDLGYEALTAVRLAVRQRNEAGGLAGRYLVEFVALNDFSKADESVVQARKMAVDPGVMAVIGGWSAASAAASSAEYERLGLAFVAPPSDLTDAADSPTVNGFSAQQGTDFSTAYKTLSGGAEPTAAAIWAYEAAIELMDAMESAVRTGRGLTRAGVSAALGRN